MTAAPVFLPTTEAQQQIQHCLAAACRRLGTDQLSYRSEWLGHLPYGQYHWVEVGGEQVSSKFPAGWQYSDLQVLIARGRLEVIAEFRPEPDSDDVEVRMRWVSQIPQ
jgi:hypothetical protein